MPCLLTTGNCDADSDYIGTEFLLLFMENELQDMELALELHYAEQNDQTVTIVVQSPNHITSQLPSVLSINPGRT